MKDMWPGKSFRWFATLLVTGFVLFGLMPSAHAAAEQWTDPAGDVTSPNADMVGGSANVSVSEGMVDLRVRFTAPPFAGAHTHSLTWCFDTDQNATTGNACGGPFVGGGEDESLGVFDSQGGALLTCAFGFGGTIPINHSHLWYDATSNTFRVLFPLSLMSDDGNFNYGVASVFGGSFGANDSAPDSIDFGSPGGFFTSEIGPLPPFNGVPWCRPPGCPPNGGDDDEDDDGLEDNDESLFGTLLGNPDSDGDGRKDGNDDSDGDSEDDEDEDDGTEDECPNDSDGDGTDDEDEDDDEDNVD